MLGLKRAFERKDYSANIVFAHKKEAYRGTIKNLSLGGAFIATAFVNQFDVDDYITISIPYTTGRKHVKRQGRIKWTNDEGFAIEFL